MNPVRVPLAIMTKRATFFGEINMPGVDRSSWRFRMQVRPAAGNDLTSLVTLNDAGTATYQGINAAYDPTLFNRQTGLLSGGTRVTMRIERATLEAIEWGELPPDEPLDLAYDILAIEPDQAERLFVYGPLTLYPGVTI